MTYLTLSNGLRVAHIGRQSRAEYCGIAVRAGSSDEEADEHGLAHFVEHTIFKGTANRSASRIINHMECVGGELNAYTTKEETYVYSVFPAGNLRRAVDLIADLAINSRFPDAELDREREVVAEEIDSYLDTPSEAVFDDFEDEFFKGSPLGHNILGDIESLRSFDSAKCRSFVNRYYTAPNMVFFYLGPEPVEKVCRLAERYFAQLPVAEAPRVEKTYTLAAPFTTRRDANENHQAHTVIGAAFPSLYSPQRYAAALLCNILGGPGMNSRLNVSLRERRGLVYSVESAIASYTSTGLMTIYYGCNPEDERRCHRLVTTQLRRLADRGLTQRALDAARRQFIGQQTVAATSAEQSVLSAARQLLFYGKLTSIEESASIINALTLDDIARAARLFTPDRFSSLTLG